MKRPINETLQLCAELEKLLNMVKVKRANKCMMQMNNAEKKMLKSTERIQ